MRPINIYALTRLSDPQRLERLERQMSGRARFLKIKTWEMEGLKSLCEELRSVMDRATELCFYYSFVMPKLGKEFDLIRIGAGSIVNIELKSGEVSDEVIRKQLLQNRHYLSILKRSMYFYTYVSRDGRLVRLSNAGRLVEAGFEELAMVLGKQEQCYTGDIEALFKEEQYLISPLTDPDRFLRQDYFLTAQQNDIKAQILKRIRRGNGRDPLRPVQGFTGLPGTGKSLLLYDLAMELSHSNKVCILHPGVYTKEIELLSDRLKRIDFYCGDIGSAPPKQPYSVILVDEGHRITFGEYNMIRTLAGEWKAPVIFAYDNEEPVAPEERKGDSVKWIEDSPGFVRYRLTNRIRLNNELSAFIHCVMCIKGRNQRREFPNVTLAYARDDKEMGILLKDFINAGYTYIHDPALDTGKDHEMDGEIEAAEADCKEFDSIVMFMDKSFYYDDEGCLRSVMHETSDHRVRNLFHGLNRAKQRIAVIIKENTEVFDRILGVLQRK